VCCLSARTACNSALSAAIPTERSISPSLGLPGAGTGGRIDLARFKRCRFAFLRNPANTSFRLPGCPAAPVLAAATWPGLAASMSAFRFPVSPDGWSVLVFGGTPPRSRHLSSFPRPLPNATLIAFPGLACRIPVFRAFGTRQPSAMHAYRIGGANGTEQAGSPCRFPRRRCRHVTDISLLRDAVEPLAIGAAGASRRLSRGLPRRAGRG
jgi:hypothetical protein